MTNIGAQLRDNPLPLLLISAGVGLVMSRSLGRCGSGTGGSGICRDGDRAGDYTGRARSGLSTLVTEQPWVLGALGLLVGAALASGLPRSQIEQDYVGSAAQHLRDQASNMAAETYERAKAAASRAVDVASREFAAESDVGAGGAASGGPSSGGPSTATSHPTTGAGAHGVSAGAGGARPTETIAAGSTEGTKSQS